MPTHKDQRSALQALHKDPTLVVSWPITRGWAVEGIAFIDKSGRVVAWVKVMRLEVLHVEWPPSE